MTDIRPFDAALFGDAAIDPDTANLNAQMIELLTGQPEWWIVGAQEARAARRRGRGSFSRACVLGSGANHYHHRERGQPNPPARNRTGATARGLSASAWWRLGTWRRGHARSDAGADRRQHRSGHCRGRISPDTGASLPGGSGRLRNCRRLACSERQERVWYRRPAPSPAAARPRRASASTCRARRMNSQRARSRARVSATAIPMISLAFLTTWGQSGASGCRPDAPFGVSAETVPPRRGTWRIRPYNPDASATRRGDCG